MALGAPLLEIGDTRALEIVAELLTTDALQAAPGSRCVDRALGRRRRACRAACGAVEPAAFTKVSALGVEEQRVSVLIDITAPPEQWRALGDGYRVGVRIVTLAVDNALRVPVSAVFPLPDKGKGDGDDGPAMGGVRRAGRPGPAAPVEVVARNGAEAWLGTGWSPATP